jgi:hypothetical protein
LSAGSLWAVWRASKYYHVLKYNKWVWMVTLVASLHRHKLVVHLMMQMLGEANHVNTNEYASYHWLFKGYIEI